MCVGLLALLAGDSDPTPVWNVFQADISQVILVISVMLRARLVMEDLALTASHAQAEDILLEPLVLGVMQRVLLATEELTITARRVQVEDSLMDQDVILAMHLVLPVAEEVAVIV